MVDDSESLKKGKNEMKHYELYLHYANGEIDEYYSRLTGSYWDAESIEDAIGGMSDDIAEAEACENVTYWEVEEVR